MIDQLNNLNLPPKKFSIYHNKIKEKIKLSKRRDSLISKKFNNNPVNMSKFSL